MRDADIVVPSLVTVPDRAKEHLVITTTLVHIGTGVAIHISGKFLDDDKVCKTLLIHMLSPSFCRVRKVTGIQMILDSVKEIGNVLILGRIEVVILRILVCHLDILLCSIPVSVVNISLYYITSGNLLRIISV